MVNKMNLFKIAARIAVGEPNIPNKTYRDAYYKAAIRAQEEAESASRKANDVASHKECVQLFLKAEKAWGNVGHGYREVAKAMHNKAYKHDQALKAASLSGETYGIKLQS